MKKAVGDKLWAAVVAVSKMLTRLIPVKFSLAFYTTFSHPSSYALRLFFTFLIMMKNFQFSPNLYTTA
jgi:hypothetical protein